jgi:hypothetical protein
LRKIRERRSVLFSRIGAQRRRRKARFAAQAASEAALEGGNGGAAGLRSRRQK